MKNRFQYELIFGGMKQRFRKDFGGSDIKSNPKCARPISTNRAMHVVIKTQLGRSECNFLTCESDIRAKIKKLCAGLGIKIYRGVVMKNHIHLILKTRTRRAMIHLLRELGSFLGMKFVTKSPLFSGRPFTRILEWGRDLRGVYRYLRLNELEKMGIEKTRGRGLLVSATSLGRYAPGNGS